MKLYLDLSKAGAQYSSGVSSKKDDQSSADYDESFSETHSGVSGDTASYDSPDKGAKWSHKDSLDDELEGDRQKRNKKAQDRNLVPTKEDLGIKKAFDTTAMDMVKSITGGLREAFAPYTQTEIEFLHVVKGFPMQDIKKGTARITGRDRKLFSEWLCERVQKSLDELNSHG